MGIGSCKRIVIAFVGGLAVSLVGTAAVQGFERTIGVWKVLRDGHFSGPMNEDAHVRPVKGSISAKGKHYTFLEYSWQESPKNMTGSTPHAQSRLLVLEQSGSGLSYLGSYDFAADDFKGPVRPVIRGKTLFFPYHDIEILGDKRSYGISFEKGPPVVPIPGSVDRFAR
jgi:hypothetical protein